jgi:16S rRNA (cytosine967-C5)-methyltransferase
MSARDIATTRIAHQARRFPNLDLRPPPAEGVAALDARDAALASAIEHAVLRRWLTLVAVIETQLARPWDELEHKLQAALLCGAAQLLLMDRLPEYAVIDESVEWTKVNVRPKAGSMVNAVLRKIAVLRGERSQSAFPWPRNALPLDDGRTLELHAAIFAEDALQRLSQQTSHPVALFEYWISLSGREETVRIASHDLVHAPIIVHGVADDAAAAPSGDSRLQPHREAGFFVLQSGGHAPVIEFLRAHPQAIVQDPASAAPVLATAAFSPAPRLIIDACAGNGTKTRQLARLHPQAQIIATDIDRVRLQTLTETFRDHPRVRVVEQPQLMEFAGAADLVLLDVPCSNTGVLARRVEAKYRFSRAALRGLINVQRQIIADSLNLLHPKSGRLLYATCSIDPAENAEQSKWIAQWHPLVVEQEQVRQPRGLPGESASEYNDGGYWAMLKRNHG